ncbi:MAG TPA: cytochrome c peroxidase [Acetobacteraceae bacterium]|nr:cytochrome c peroxidase [Acetobacteraceae bacterium]
MREHIAWAVGLGLLLGVGALATASPATLATAAPDGRMSGHGAVTAGLAPGVVQDPIPPDEPRVADGWNPHPIHLIRPAAAPLSAMALLGKRIFVDASLSASGRLACASCHSPRHCYGPPNDLPAMRGGPAVSDQGVRAVPSLMYLERQPNFSIGPDNEENETVSLTQMAAAGQVATRTRKTAHDTVQTAANLVPQGGLFWDGRADTLQQQALVPMLNPIEMDGGSVEAVATHLHHAAYATDMQRLFGPSIFADPAMAVAEALFAVARYQVEEPSFHPYSSKFDDWLQGKARFTPAEQRGYRLFNDPKKANCGGCHLDQPTPDGRPPLFTDHQFEALGAPRNMALTVNRDPAYFDLGICGPYRDDMAEQTQYCGMFLTPTLRNVATRHVFFHNGVFDSLRQVMDFYDFRDVAPGRVYPHGADGSVAKFDDIPRKYWPNVDVADPPFDRKPGDAPAMTPGDEADIIAFLRTLTDGYTPAGR